MLDLIKQEQFRFNSVNPLPANAVMVTELQRDQLLDYTGWKDHDANSPLNSFSLWGLRILVNNTVTAPTPLHIDKWHFRFLDLAQLIATWSKDPSTQVGAVIVDDKNRIMSVGFNGPPREVPDECPLDRDEKLRRTIHAEQNAILFGGSHGHTIYTTFPPCARCQVPSVPDPERYSQGRDPTAGCRQAGAVGR